MVTAARSRRYSDLEYSGPGGGLCYNNARRGRSSYNGSLVSCLGPKPRHGMAPSYLSTYCMPTSSHGGRCHLRSATSGQLSVPHTTTNYGDRSFAVSGPTAWNSLPAALRLDMPLSVFRTRQKTFLMTQVTTPVTVDVAHLLHFSNLCQ